MFFEMQPMQQVTKKCSQILPKKATKIEPKTPKMQPRWPLGAHMGAKMPPKTLQKQPKRSCFSRLFQAFGGKCSQEPPRTPKTAQLGAKRAPKSSPDPLWTLISI